MDDLIAFLRARLDDAAAESQQWHQLECEVHVHLTGAAPSVLAATSFLQDVPGAVCDCGGPARVLAEVDAKRRRLELLADAIHRGHDDYDIATELLPLEALPYADHPDYQDTWRP
ncbi:hypothetical protein EAO70_04830 [Streptomyces sp. adm13(2018)]|nr:hypothetical protein EAO70_04830 [Streptomyces sp. adm13(2018)]